MTPDHGTRARYLRGCHCDDCRTAHAAYCKRYRYVAAVDTRRGRPKTAAKPLRMDAAPVREHIARLVASGMTLAEIQRESGTSNAHASKLMHGQPRVHRAIAARILAVEPIPDPASVIDEVAVRRVLDENADAATLTRAEKAEAIRLARQAGRSWNWIERVLRVSGSAVKRATEEAS